MMWTPGLPAGEGCSHCCSTPARLLHLFAARGLRWAAYAAAEVLQMYRQLDIREHKGKVRARRLDFCSRRRGLLMSEGRALGVQADFIVTYRRRSWWQLLPTSL